MRALLLFILLITSTAAHADSYRFSKGLVVDGESVAKLIDRAGQPARIVQLENKYGGAVAERWEYYIGDKMIAFVIQGGRIVSISES